MVAPGRIGLTDDGAAFDSAAGEECELLRQMIASGSRCQRTDRAAEFARHHDHGVVVETGSLQVGNQLAETVVQLLGERRQLGLLINVDVHVPAAERDLDIPGALIGARTCLAVRQALPNAVLP